MERTGTDLSSGGKSNREAVEATDSAAASDAVAVQSQLPGLQLWPAKGDQSPRAFRVGFVMTF